MYFYVSFSFVNWIFVGDVKLNFSELKRADMAFVSQKNFK